VMDGPKPESFPAIISTAPVSWNNDVSLKFSAGVFGIKQDKETLALSSVMSWVVTKKKPAPAVVLPSNLIPTGRKMTMAMGQDDEDWLKKFLGED
jgi:hypothetical protein